MIESPFNRITHHQNEAPELDLDIAESSLNLILYSHKYRLRTTEENHRVGDTVEVHLRKIRNALVTKNGIITEIDANNRVKTDTCPRKCRYSSETYEACFDVYKFK